jgi:Histidine kinase-, DNA gyrase B-, and HSP90-like ATPase
MAETKTKGGVVKLRPRASIIRVLGDELISDDTVALTELVKNSYDADATDVHISFSGPIARAEGSLKVSDNGVGMSLETVRNGWFEPATSIKKGQDKKVTPGGRRVLGEKGIGRFAAARLAHSMEMITRAEGSPFEIRVVLDWSRFDGDGYLDEVECSWEEREPERISEHGTIITLHGLKSRWDRERLGSLRYSLSRLVSPFEEAVDFSIHLGLPREFNDLAGEIAPSKLLKSPDYVIKGNVDEAGKYTLVYTQRGAKPQELQGELTQKGRAACGPFDIELRVWDRDRPGIQRLAEIFHKKQTEIRHEMDSSAGVHIYRDKFRVLPYGEAGIDWLQLDHRRIQNPTLRVSNNQVVGCILITADGNPQLKDQSNREGIFAGPAFEELKSAVRNVLMLLEERRYKARPRDVARREKGGLFADLTLEPIRQAILRTYPLDKDTLALIDSEQKSLSARLETVQEILARYRRLATLGQLVDIILHDGRTPLNKISTEA